MAQRSIFFDQTQPFEERLEAVMKSVKALSSTDDPREMVQVFGEEVGSLLERDASLSMTRRHVPAPQFQISRYTDQSVTTLFDAPT